MKNKTLWIVLGIVAVVVIWCIASYNGLVGKQESVVTEWANVETQYQRRADLIPQLVNTVKGYAAHEKSTLEEVTEARTRATQINVSAEDLTPEAMAEYVKVQNEVGSALGRLIAVAESYPDLKANQNFLEFQSQLEGTENRISEARRRYNLVAREYNQSVRRFPTNIVAGIFGFERKPLFEAQEGAQTAPVVEF
ncbi:MAG: LemA family protein [Alistipes sp.]|nr:LemA family protein [Alistipes sp.]MDE6861220.1 LemA family protein [Alistipes sp.]